MKDQSNLKASIGLIRGAGEKASAVAHLLHQVGLKRIVMTDLPVPTAERRGVAFCAAIVEGRKQVSGVEGRRSEPSLSAIHRKWDRGEIAVIADPEARVSHVFRPDILIDAVMAKKNTGTTLNHAPLVIALGPGFTAGVDAHLVVETNPASPLLGRVISEGEADSDTHTPTPVLGLTAQRLIRAPAEGVLFLLKKIGERIAEGETIGYAGSSIVKACVSGSVWGLVREGLNVKQGQKIGDIDPRGERDLCFQITPQARAIAEGVVRAIVSSFNR